MVYLEENRDTGRNVEPLRRDCRESHLPAIREQEAFMLYFVGKQRGYVKGAVVAA